MCVYIYVYAYFFLDCFAFWLSIQGEDRKISEPSVLNKYIDEILRTRGL